VYGVHRPADAEAIFADIPEVMLRERSKHRNVERSKDCDGRRAPRFSSFFIAVAAIMAPTSVRADMLVIRRPAEITRAELIEITDQQIVYWREGHKDQRVDVSSVVALVDDAARVKYADRGMLVLADGQRLPGEAISGAKTGADVLVWNHREFGRLEAPLGLVRSVSFNSTEPPPPAHAMDVLRMANGDQVEGVITSLGDPITLTLGSSPGGRLITQPIDRVASVSMVAPRRPFTGMRVWLTDGSVVDVAQLRLGHDGLVRLTLAGSLADELQHSLKLSDIQAVLFDASGATPLASVAPTSIDGPRTRYTLPEPVATNPAAPIGLSPIEISGPLTVRYALPEAPVEFVAEAVLPQSHRAWGNLELIVLDDSREVMRTRLNASRPSAPIRLLLTGSELTIRIEEGANGPLQDTVVLEHALLLNAR
jgi:hypothetical protein